MKLTLVMDPGTGEMRLRMDCLYDGQHERTEYNVVDYAGTRLRNLPDFHGRTVHGRSGNYYLRSDHGFDTTRVLVDETQKSETVKTPCPKASNPRRKCDRCTDGSI